MQAVETGSPATKAKTQACAHSPHWSDLTQIRKSAVAPAEPSRSTTCDAATGECVLEIVNGSGAFRIDDIDLEDTTIGVERYSFRGDDPDSVRDDVVWVVCYRRGAWSTCTVTTPAPIPNGSHFCPCDSVEAFERDERIFERTSVRNIERDLA